MFHPQAYKGQSLQSLLADLDAIGDLSRLPKKADWHLIQQLAGGLTPDPIEFPTTTYQCEPSTKAIGPPVFDLPNLRVDEYIGGGKFGWVYSASIISTGFVVAVKILRKKYVD